jgi:hypothetical protein
MAAGGWRQAGQGWREMHPTSPPLRATAMQSNLSDPELAPLHAPGNNPGLKAQSTTLPKAPPVMESSGAATATGDAAATQED